jgi:DNA end-binding protein Ku
MRAIWSGSISFGLINIPVQLFSATIEHAIDLDMLHKTDLSPIRFARICKSEEKEVPWKDIVKGYEYEKGAYIVLTEEDFLRASPKRGKALEIQCFINENEVDPMYYDKPYFLEPGKGAAKTYVLLNEALKKSKKVGVANYIFHTKPHLGLIKPVGRGIILQQLRFASEVKNFAEIEFPVAKIQPKELDIAVKLIEQLTEKFQPEKFKDTYKEELETIIAEKTKGKIIFKEEEAPQATAVTDLMQQLKASLTKYSRPKNSRSPKRRVKS